MTSSIIRQFVSRSGLAVLLTLAVGCGSSNQKSGGFTLSGSLKEFFLASPAEMAEMAFDPDDADRRREAIVSLSARQWGLKEPYLKGYATLLNSDENRSVRSAAARALGKAGDARYLPDVVNALDDEAASVRWDAAAALDILIGEAAVDPLRRRAMEDESLDVRASCTKALRHYRLARAVRTLRQCLGDESFAVRYQAHASLVAIVGRDFGYEPSGWPTEAAWRDADRGRKKANRPWWDWFNVSSSRGAKRRRNTSTSRPSARGKT